MSQALTLRFASDVEGARRAMTSLATSVATNMTAIAGSMALAQRAGDGLGTALGSIAQRGLGLAGFLAIGTAMAAAFKVMEEATELARERIEEYVRIAEKAANASVSIDFFQRMTRGAAALNVEIQTVQQSIEKLASISKDALGGSALGNRIDELVEAGNFAGNTGVAAFRSATTVEEKYRAIVRLISEALDKGERLAALDIADRIGLGDKVRQNSAVLKDILRTADEINKTELVSEENVGRAIELKNRLDAAHATLAGKWKPVLDDLARAGLNYQESWVGIIELLAKASTIVGTIYGWMKSLTDLAQAFGNLDIWNKFNDLSRSLGLYNENASLTVQDDARMQAARDALAARLRNPANILQGTQQAIDIQTAVRGDRSRAPGADNSTASLDAVERYINQLERARDVEQAELDNLGRSNAERERAVALARAEAAARAAGRDLTDEERQKIEQLASAHATLSDRLKDQRQRIQENAEAIRTFGQLAADGLADAILEGKSFNDILKNTEKQIARMIINAALWGGGPLAGILGTAVPASAPPGTVGGIVGWLAGLFGGARAGGGDVEPGKIYRINELGQEFFVPRVAGRVYPAGSFPGGGLASVGQAMHVYAPVTVIAPDPPSFNQSRGQIERSLGEAFRRAARFQ